MCAVVWLKHMGLLCLCLQINCLDCVFAFRMFAWVVFFFSECLLNKLFALSFGFQNVYFCCVCKSIVVFSNPLFFMVVFANPLLQNCCRQASDRNECRLGNIGTNINKLKTQ